MVVMAARRDRYLPFAGIVASLFIAAVAAGDVHPFTRLALVEFVVAAAGLLVSVASFAGLLRAVHEEPTPERDTDTLVTEIVGAPASTEQ
jgi:hypothetical protein